MPPSRPASFLTSLRASLAAAFLLLFLPLTVPLLTWRVFPFGDLSAFHVPMRFIYREALRAGDTFLWTPWLESGLYVHAEGQTGMAHPLHLVAYRVLPLTIAINLEMLGVYVFALTGMWLLLRRLGIRSEAAFGGALTFAFGGFMLPHLNHLNAIGVAAHIPWIVLAADSLIGSSFHLTSLRQGYGSPPKHYARRRKAEATSSSGATNSARATGASRALGFAGVALLLGSQVLLGFPQIVWMTALIVGWFILFRLVTGTPMTRVLPLACALILGLMIGGAQLLPTLDAARESFRSATVIPFRSSFSLHPINLLQLFSPYALRDGIYAPSAEEWFPHEFGLYDSALATISVAWILTRLRTLPRRDLAIAFLGLAALGLVLALGRYGGVYPMLARLPILSSFRAPTRHVLVVHLALAGLVALTLEDLLQRTTWLPPVRIWPVVVPAALSAAATAAALAGSAWASAHGVPTGPPWRAIGGLLFAVLTAWVFIRGARGAAHAVALLIMVAAVDLACWGLPYAYAYRPAPIGKIVPSGGLPPGPRRGDLVHPQVVLDDMNKYALWGLRTQLAYLGLARSSVLDPEALVTQRLAGVKWRWTPAAWAAVDGAMPRVRLVPQWRVSQDIRGDLTRIDIGRTALVDASPGGADAPAGTARLLDDRPGRLRIETAAPSAQLLVVAERYHEGWIAQVDGVASPTRRVYGDYLGCVTPSGVHRVDFVFAPQSARHGLWLTLAGLALTIIGARFAGRFESA